MKYTVQPGDSPSKIARRYGVSMNALLGANPHKPLAVVAGQRTWRGLSRGETVRVPVGGGVGDWLGAVTPALPGAPHAQIKQGSSGADVALWQTIIGTTPDGVFGPNTASATKAWQGTHGLAADGIVGPKTWAAALGGAVPSAQPAPVQAAAAPTSLTLAASAAAASAALVMDPGYCSSVAKSGTPVNTAIHNFKTAWNSANPSSPLPINTGKYEPVVASALSSSLGGLPVPPGCGAAPAAAAAMPISIPSLPSLPTAIPSITPVNAPAAAAALATIDPCYSGNVSMVCAAQSVLGVTVDGKYGNDTANALRRLVPSAPAGCSPRPSWWTPTGQSNCPGAASMPSLPSLPSLPASMPSVIPGLPALSIPVPPGMPSTLPIPVGPAQPTVTSPDAKHGLSTGAMVAGGLGVVALLGIVAIAASNHKTTTTRSTTTHGPARRKKATKKKRKK